MKHFQSGERWLLLLLTLWAVIPARAQSPKDAAFLATLGEMLEASYSDKAAIAERLSQTGHPSVRAVLTALMEDRLYYRNSDQKVYVFKSAEGDPVYIIDPILFKSEGP